MLNIQNCILCGSDSDLDTEMAVTFEEKKIAVKLCSKCSEDATPKAVREAYGKRKAEIDAFIEQAKKLGLTISQPQVGPAGLTIANAPPPQAQQSQPSQVFAQPTVVHGNRADGVVSAEEADRALRRVGSAAGVATGAVGSANLEGHKAYDPEAMLESKLPEGTRDGIVQLGVMEGRQGIPITVPVVRQDGTGTTTIRITQHVRDQQMLERFKSMADRSRRDEGPCFRTEYELASCPICKGETTIQINQGGEVQRVLCPKCKGSGLRSS